MSTDTCPHIKIRMDFERGSEGFWVEPLGNGTARIANNLSCASLAHGDIVTIEDGVVTGVQSRGQRLQVQVMLKSPDRPSRDRGPEARFLDLLAQSMRDDEVSIETGLGSIAATIPSDWDLDEVMFAALDYTLAEIEDEDFIALRDADLCVFVLSCPCAPLTLDFHDCLEHPSFGLFIDPQPA